MTVVPLLLNRCEFEAGRAAHLHLDDWFFTRRDIPTVRTFHGSALYEAMYAARWRRQAEPGGHCPLELRAARLATARFGVAPGADNWLRRRWPPACGVDAPAGKSHGC